MRRRPRTRRILKWMGLAGSVTLFGVGAATAGCECGYYNNGFCIGVGSLNFFAGTHAPKVDGTGFWCDPWRWPVEFDDLLPVITRVSGIPITFVMPLWIPLVLVGLPTAILWYRDRRPPKGYCQNCGYDLTGNVSGVCPECGCEAPAGISSFR